MKILKGKKLYRKPWWVGKHQCSECDSVLVLENTKEDRCLLKEGVQHIGSRVILVMECPVCGHNVIVAPR